jgi:hypothetical protein
MKIPLPYILLLATVIVLGAVVALVWFNFLTVSAIFFELTNIVLLSLLFVFAALGGAFVGMLMTHRMLANREFSPTERTVLEINAEIRAVSKRLEAMEEKLDGIAAGRAPGTEAVGAESATRAAVAGRGSKVTVAAEGAGRRG